MKKILFVLSVLLLGITSISAKVTNKVNVYLASDSEGRGYVHADTKSSVNSNYTTTNKNVSKSSADYWIYTSPASAIYIFARESSAQYYFIGWSEDNNVEHASITQQNGYLALPEAAHQSSNVTNTKTFYAHFGEVTKRTMVLNNVDVQYVGCKYSASYNFLNSTSNAPVITTDVSTKVTLADITDKTAYKFSLEARPASGYNFYRWRIEYEDRSIVYLNDAKTEFTFAQSGDLYCEFISNEYAQFMLKTDKSRAYLKLSEAIAAASVETGDKKVIVVKESGRLHPEDGDVPGIYSAGTYTIPSGVTLLVPGDDAYTVRKGDILEDDYINEDQFKANAEWVTKYEKITKMHALYTELIIPSGVKLDFYGNLCVYAKVAMVGAGAVNNCPISYGQLVLEHDEQNNEGAEIILNSGVSANVYGYITGNPMYTKVHAKSGSHVYEMMQVTDYRGGTATTSMLGNGVFSFSHYYVQNVETKLVFEYGSYERVSAGFAVTGAEPFETLIFIAPRTGTGVPGKDQESAFFAIADGAVLEKYLDRDTDRQKYVLKSESAVESLVDKMILNMKALVIFGFELNSAEYVVPFTSNMDVRVEGKAKVRVPYSMAMLAGSSLFIDTEAEVIAMSNIFVYDKDQLMVQISKDLGTYKNGEWLYYYSSLATQSPSDLQLKYQSATPIVRDANWPNDAEIDVRGKITGAIYTTGDGTGENPGGASIVCRDGASGVVQFSPNLQNSANTYQYVQYVVDGNQKIEKMAIVNTSARLKNGDEISYSAGEGTKDQNKEYVYYPNAKNEGSAKKGRWIADVQDGTIEAKEINGNKLTVYIPENVPSEVSFVASGSNLTIGEIKEITSDNNNLIVDKQNVSYDSNTGRYIVDFTYIPTKNNLEQSSNVKITYACVHTETGETIDVSTDIGIKITEDYTPRFTITDGSSKETENVLYNFAAQLGGSDSKTVIVTPCPDNVCENSNYISWEISQINPSDVPFAITGDCLSPQGMVMSYLPIVYKDGGHAASMSITATYQQANGTPITTTKMLNIKGTPVRLNNDLAFVTEPREIYLSDVISPLITNYHKDGDIYFLLNGKTEHDVLEIIPSNDNQNYQLKVKESVNILQPCTVYVEVKQNAGNVYNSAEDQMTLVVKPLVQWNWENLYFDHEYDNPVDVAPGYEDYTLVFNDDCELITSYDEENQTIEVGSGDESIASFTFTHGGWSITLQSNIYANPRLLDMCLSDANASRTFQGVTVDITKDMYGQPLVKFDNGVKFLTSPTSGVQWTFAIDEVPDKLLFSTIDKNRWTVYESATSTFGNAALIPTVIGEQLSYQLSATTKYIRVVCSPGEEMMINTLCVYELDGVTCQTKKVYLPILRDAERNIVRSEESVELNYVSVGKSLSLSVQNSLGNTMETLELSQDVLAETTIDNLYNQVEITISNIGHSVEETLYLVAKDGEDLLFQLPIRLYNRPQLLPMMSSLWQNTDAEKYHFYVDKSKSQYVQYNEETLEIEFLPSSSEQRFVSFEFKGGPSFISFETDIETTTENWNNYWNIEVFDGISYTQISTTPQIEVFDNGGAPNYRIKWNVPYTSKSLTLENKFSVDVHKIHNLIIDGDPDLDVQPGNSTIEHTAKYVFKNTDIQDVTVTAINLATLKVRCNNSNFDVKFNGTAVSKNAAQPTVLDATTCPGILDDYEVGNLTFQVSWKATNTIDEGLLIFMDASGKELATVRLLGTEDYITADNADETGLYTGFAESITSHPFQTMFAEDKKYEYERRQVNLSNAFTNGIALFDYLIVYGETTTTTNDNTTTITAPTGANIVDGVSNGKGSNAKTPYYIYRKALDGEGQYTHYQLVGDVENANVAYKAELEQIKEGETQLIPHAQDQDLTKCIQIGAGESLKVYVTGFCPYATTGYDKRQEGVWLFRGKPTAKLDLYLEDCHIYSRNKTASGCTSGKFDFDYIFDDPYACGSGGVFVFENNVDKNGDVVELVPESDAFQVNIHTRGLNVLKSNYGSFYQIYGMRAYQVSSPIQVRVSSDGHVEKSRTHLTFDDLWPTQGEAVRTNGFLSLQKLANNAPSIDLGNPQTVVNFRGGQVELQNAQNVSDKYKTTLAISYRSGIMAAGGIELQMAYGIGTDDATKGTVNFYDGTITVIPMEVDESERQYYLMDTEITTDGEGNQIETELTTTSCLRCPQNTFVHGGSICMLRACMSPTSKGGAPTDGVDNGSGEFTPLGRFIYDGSKYSLNYYNNAGVIPSEGASLEKWLVNPTDFPEHEVFGLLSSYYNRVGFNYGLNSVTPDKNGNLTLWIPQGYGDVKVEIDRYLIPWKACMTEIEAGLGTFTGRIGGNVSIENNEDVSNLLYCHLDDFTHAVISEHDEISDPQEGIIYSYKYSAPVKTPDNFQMQGMEIGEYFTLQPTNVGDKVYEVTNAESYKIHNKVYYITTALSDTWMNFTMPFDVENIYVVESYPDFKLEKQFETYPSKTEELEDANLESKMDDLLILDPRYYLTRMYQGKHNADFASFFGMAMALGSDATFEEMQQDFLDWAYLQDSGEGADDYKGTRKDYDWRGVWPLTHYDGSIESFMNSNFYLYENTADWQVDAEVKEFTTNWQIVPKREANQPLLRKGHSYSMLFPYCWGCDEEPYDMERGYWDYWTGKFLIFESTTASAEQPHVIAGRNQAIAEFNASPSSGNAKLMGNISFAKFAEYGDDNLFYYQSSRESGGQFWPVYNVEEQEFATIYPTNTLLSTSLMGLNQVQSISRDGKINYYNSGNSQGPITGGHVPTVGGNKDMFITAINGGINIAVAAPQLVYVVNATGHIIYSGYVTTDVNVMLPINGIYVVKGENEAQKIFF